MGRQHSGFYSICAWAVIIVTVVAMALPVTAQKGMAAEEAPGFVVEEAAVPADGLPENGTAAGSMPAAAENLSGEEGNPPAVGDNPAGAAEEPSASGSGKNLSGNAAENGNGQNVDVTEEGTEPDTAVETDREHLEPDTAGVAGREHSESVPADGQAGERVAPESFSGADGENFEAEDSDGTEEEDSETEPDDEEEEELEEEEEDIENLRGTIGTLEWELVPQNDGEAYTLRFAGSGEIPSQFFSDAAVAEAVAAHQGGITQIEVGAGITAIGSSAFRGGLPALQRVSFAEGTALQSIGAHAFDGCAALAEVALTGAEQLSSIGDSAFYNCVSLQGVDLEHTRLTQISGNTFYGCSALAQVALPEGLKTIGRYAFGYTKALSQVTFPESLMTLSEYAFSNSGLTGEVVIPGSVKTLGSGNSGPFPYCHGITRLTFRENEVLTGFPGWVFAYNNGLATLDLSGLHALQSLNSVMVQTGSTDTGILELIVGAEALTSVSTSVFANGGYSNAERITIRLTEDVKQVSQTLFQAAGRRLRPFFAPNHDLVITGGALRDTTDQRGPFITSAGRYHADENGVLYALRNDGTAMLFYCPPDIKTYTVPENITDETGKSYPVTEVGSDAFRIADELTELNFVKPQQVSLDAGAFTGSHIQKIEGRDVIRTADFGDVSQLCDFPIDNTISPSDVVQVNYNTPEGSTFVLSIYNTERDRLKDGVYTYLTGESASIWFGFNNEKNADMENLTVRIYLAFDGDGENLGTYLPGSYTIINTSADPNQPDQTVTHEYPMQVVKTNVPGIYYYDLTGLQPGDVMAFSNGYMYNSVSSDGGNLRIWGKVLTHDEAEAQKGQISNPEQYVQMRWETSPIPYTLKKEARSAGNFKLVADGTEEENIYLSGVAYSISFNPVGDSATTNGRDYVKEVEFVDKIQLPEGVRWDPEVVEQVRRGAYTYENNGYSDKGIWVTVDGEKRRICMLSDYTTGGGYTRQVTPVATEDEEIELHWKATNNTSRNSAGETYANREMAYHSYTLYVGDRVLQVDKETLYQEDETGKMVVNSVILNNRVTDVQHYSFSADQGNTAFASEVTVQVPSGLEMNKNVTSPNVYYSRVYLGQEMHYAIRLKNTGVLSRTDIGKVEDSLTNVHCILPADLQTMFDDETWGSCLTVTIQPATLCKPVNGTVAVTDGTADRPVNGQITAQESEYHGCETQDHNEETNSAVLVLSRDAGGVLTLQVGDAAGTRTATCTIGEGKDYPSVSAALEAIGYIVTCDVQYGVRWDIPGEKGLYGGQTWEFPILSTIKNTLQMLKYDNPGSYYTDSGRSANTAYAYNREGKQATTPKSAYYSGFSQFTWWKELYLYKTASVNGDSVLSGNTVAATQGDVIDYRLSFENRMGHFDVLPLVDHMEGPQILLVPVQENPELANTDLDQYTTESGVYYVLSKPGTWKNIRVGGITADSVTVTKTENGLDTLIKWYYPEQGVGSREAVYQALVDMERAGLQREAGTISFSMGNEAWLGDHETHRLYASMPGSVSVADFDKWIQTSADPLTLTRHSIVHEDDEVVYRIRIRNRSASEMTISGDQIYDELPTTRGTFDWCGRILSVAYEPQPDGEGKLTASTDTDGDTYWRVTDTLPGTDASVEEGQYYIIWNSAFQMRIEPHGEMDILITAQFPSDHEEESGNGWDSYLVRNNGAQVFNTFYLDHRASTVSHELAGEAKCVLRKGVYDTFFYMSYDNVLRRQSRGTYANGKSDEWNSRGQNSVVVYYTTVYNSGSVRLYLSDLQDQLPKGFHFAGLTTWDQVYSYADEGALMKSSVLNEVDSEYYFYTRTGERGKVFSTVDDADAAYINAHITAEVTKAEETGDEHIRYRISAPAKKTAYDIHYDAAEEKYYLEPGEVLRFGYRCVVDEETKTEESATNTIAMPFYEHYGLGVKVDHEALGKIVTTPETGVPNNDGGCAIMSNHEAGLYEFTGGSEETQWLSSNVTLTRKDIAPGIMKTVGGVSPLKFSTSGEDVGATFGVPYTGAVRTDNIINWKIRVFNDAADGEAANSLMDYTVTDVADAPYGFIGAITYQLFDRNGKPQKYGNYTGPFKLTTLYGRGYDKPDTVWVPGAISTKLDLKKPKTIPVSGIAELTLSRTEDGREQLVLHCYGPQLTVPEGCYMEFRVSTFYCSTGTVLSEQYFNRAILTTPQHFLPETVSNGSVIYDEESGEVKGIESGATVSVAMGYSTSAVKSIQEVDNEKNMARSDNEDRNFIVIDDPAKQFHYDLMVNTPEEAHAPLRKLVICDALPEVGDHAAFDEREQRGTQFTVSLAERPEFALYTIADKGSGTETSVAAQYYKVYLSEKKVFSREDWTGEAPEGWVEYPGTLSEEQQVEWAKKARSIRVVVTDPGDPEEAAYDISQYRLMPPRTQVKLSFRAHIDDEKARPGQYAWNSFGYSCTIPTLAGDITLNATPLKVGVRYPQYPRLAKTIQDEEGKPAVATRDLSFDFLLYTGTEITEIQDVLRETISGKKNAAEANAEIAGLLKDRGRSVTFYRLTVPRGADTATSEQLETLYCCEWKDGSWTPTEKLWTWANGSTCQVLELPDDSAQWTLYALGENTRDAAVLKQNTAASVRVMAVNRRTAPEAYELPSSGGPGRHRFYIPGVCLAAVAGTMLAGRKKKRTA